MIYPGDDFYLRAFSELNTCRPNTGFGVGSIPWDKVVQYAAYAGVSRELMDAFTIIIREIDDVYMAWHNKETEKKNKRAREESASSNKASANKRTRKPGLRGIT